MNVFCFIVPLSFTALYCAATTRRIIGELYDEVLQQIKTRYLKNIKNAQDTGELRSDIDPEFC
ncbi:MAG: hypothetical protein U5R06_20625 [candidate division KSB1 bacterium]|nr:hypothetical protein [candidate division KSB1 bacterium]